MSFFIAPNEDALDLVTESMAGRPEFSERYDAIKELREMDQQGLTVSVEDAAKANGFFRVANLQGPLESLAQLLDPGWLKDSKRFYRWLDAHPQHVAYDRRKRPIANRLVMSDGKVVL